MKNKNKLFSEIAKQVATQSTCLRVKVGAVLVKDDRIISMGYNGVPPGSMHCEDYFEMTYCSLLNDYSKRYKTYDEFLGSQEFNKLHAEFSNTNEIHSEMNIIAFAARNGIETEGTILYTTLSPCHACSKLIVAAGIKKVYYLDIYDRIENDGINFLRKNEVEAIHLHESF